MQNVEMTVTEDCILHITIDLNKEFGLSKSGKTVSIASTKGNVSVPDIDAVKVGLNVYKYPEK